MMRCPPADYTSLDSPNVLPFLFHPRQTPRPAERQESVRRILIPVEKEIGVGASLHMPHQTGPTILFFHGNGEIASDYDDIGPLFNRMGINLWVADYRGYGWSDGHPTVASMMSDCHRILDHVADWSSRNHFLGPRLVMGRSLGSASALELAAACGDRIDGLIIESGFAWAAPLLRRLGVDPKFIGFDESTGFSNVDKIKGFVKPTLIIHAEFDQIIPFGDGEALYSASGAVEKRLVQIPGATHNDIFVRGLDRYMEAVAALVKKLA